MAGNGLYLKTIAGRRSGVHFVLIKRTREALSAGTIENIRPLLSARPTA